MSCRRFLFSALLLLPGLPVVAVGPTGTLVGTVLDPSEAVVPAAAVTACEEDTKLCRSAITGSDGEYRIPLLPPGRYRLTIDAPNFRQTTRSGISLQVNETVRVDIPVELGLRTEVVEIEDTPPLVRGDDTMIGHVVDRAKISELPLNERNFLALTLLVPGAQPAADGSQNSTQGLTVSVNGAREQSNNYLLDGVDNNDPLLNLYSVVPSVEAIREFQVQASTSSAEYGRSGGAQINVVLRSGTNELHGSLFEFFRNRHLDAKNYFDRPDCRPELPAGTCAEIPRYDRNQFGGLLGGPIRADRMFYLLSYEGLHLRQAITREATVPSRIQKAALEAIPPAIRNPAGDAILRLYPDANAGADLATSNRFVAAPVARQTQHHGLAKLDWLPEINDRVAMHYAITDSDRFNPYDPFFAYSGLPGFGDSYVSRAQLLGLTWNRVLSPRMVNEARLGGNRLRFGVLQENSGRDEAGALGFPRITERLVSQGFPNVAVAGFESIGEPTNTPQQRNDSTIHFAETLAISPLSASRHHIRLGGEVRVIRLNLLTDIFSRGLWQFSGITGNSLQELVLGIPTVAALSQGDTFASLRTNSYNVFVQDDFRVSPAFTLNVGLRYEYNTPVVEAHDRFSVPDLSGRSLTCTPKPGCQFIRAGTEGVPRATYNSDTNNFAPRVGLAWRPSRNRSFVLRTAYGIFYDLAIANVSLSPRYNPPFHETRLIVNDGAQNIQSIVQQAGTFPAIPFVVDPNLRDGYMQQWNAGFQYEVVSGLVLDAAYVGAKGTGLVVRTDPNQARGGVRPYPQFGPWHMTESSASSSYNSLQVRGERRFRGGLSVLAAYTWSKAIDDASAMFGTSGEPGYVQDSSNRRGDRGLSNFDTRHRTVVSYVYQLPFGRGRRWASDSGLLEVLAGNWQISGILAAQTGRPFTVNRSIDQSGSGTVLITATDRPDQISDPFHPGPVPSHPDPACQAPAKEGGRAPASVRTPESWFNPCAFAAAPGLFGNAGRNTVTGPGLFNFDLALMKNFRIGSEGRYVQFRAEAFNLTNHPNFDIPDRLFDSYTFATIRSANLGGHRPPRQIQLALKYIF